MKTFLARTLPVLAMVAGALGGVSPVRAQGLFAAEEFEYGPTANLQFANGGIGWGSSWNKLSEIPTGVTSQSLTWPNLLTRGGSAFTAPYPSTAFTRYSRLLASYSDPDDTVYISCLIRPNVGYGVTAGLSFVARRRITDGQSGYRAFSPAAAAAAEVIHDYNYAQVLTLDLLAKGYRYHEVPISYRFRTTGRSFVTLGRYLRRVVPAVYRELNTA